MDGVFSLKMDSSYFEQKNNQFIVLSNPRSEYNILLSTEKRIPRKKKKFLKNNGGWGYDVKLINE